MPLQSYRDRQRGRRRRRFWMGTLVVMLIAAALAGAGYQAYQTGTDLARRDVTRLEARLAEVTEANTTLKNENDELAGALAEAKQREDKLSQRYERDVPTGPIKALLELAREKIDAGVDAERLRFVVSAAENRDECGDEPTSKRFLVKTPIFVGANDSVTFANQALTVTAAGESATDALDNPEAWYDPAKPVTVSFVQLGGKASEASGLLPLHHSVVVADREYRFSLTAGARGFVNVTGSHCPYP